MSKGKSAKSRKTKCPQCGAVAVLPIVYGYPDTTLFEDAEDGNVLIGGCIIYEGRPTRACVECDWSNSTAEPDFLDN